VEFIGEFDLVLSGFWYNTIKVATKAYHKAAYIKYILKNKR
jgi:hypothetical protein